jgi:hypothetical protein
MSGGPEGAFDRPVTPALRVELRLPQIDARIARLAGLKRRKELHHRWIGIHGGEWLAIGFAPSAQAKTRRDELDCLRGTVARVLPNVRPERQPDAGAAGWTTSARWSG